MPLKAHGVDAQVYSKSTNLAQLGFDQEVAAIHQRETLHFAANLIWRPY